MILRPLLMKRLADLAIEPELDFGFAYRAEKPLDFPAMVKQNQSRYRAHTVALRDQRVLVDVDLHDPCVGAPGRDRLYSRRERPARRAPRRPEIDQHRPISLQHRLIEIAIVYLANVCAHGISPRRISSVIARVIHPEHAVSATPCRCMSARSLLPATSIKVTSLSSTTPTGSPAAALCCQVCLTSSTHAPASRPSSLSLVGPASLSVVIFSMTSPSDR